jgi:hypothetical protein
MRQRMYGLRHGLSLKPLDAIQKNRNALSTVWMKLNSFFAE